MDDTQENFKANRVVRLLRVHARWGGNLKETQQLIRDLIENDWWRTRTIDGDTRTYNTFTAFCEDDAEHGLETDIEIIKRLAEEDEETGRLFREVTTAPNHRPTKETNDIVITSKPEQGNSRSYLATRLHRDHPSIYKRVLSGELSVYAGAVEAGIKKRNFSVPIDPDRAASIITSRFEFDDLVKLRDLLSLHIEEESV